MINQENQSGSSEEALKIENQSEMIELIIKSTKYYLEYVSDRWRAYYGTDFKYVPAKKELDDRAANDYRLVFYLITPY